MAITTIPRERRKKVEEYCRNLQDSICGALEKVDGSSRFREDQWTHPDGGGGRTRVLRNGSVFEKAGVNFSSVTSNLSESLAAKLSVPPQQVEACGISLVLHPASPMVPIVHMNLRYIELHDGDAWFGGGADLTPHYLFAEDARHFHETLKAVCDRHGSGWYARFKRQCDGYFFIKHRNEARGVGGIFFDYERGDLDRIFAFVCDLGDRFLEAYLPIVSRRRTEPWGERERAWQQIRRGRYVEFNLVYDRGTLFGLETSGRTESILMSLPPDAAWPYAFEPEPGSREEALLRVLRKPEEWA